MYKYKYQSPSKHYRPIEIKKKRECILSAITNQNEFTFNKSLEQAYFMEF